MQKVKNQKRKAALTVGHASHQREPCSSTRGFPTSLLLKSQCFIWINEDTQEAERQNNTRLMQTFSQQSHLSIRLQNCSPRTRHHQPHLTATPRLTYYAGAPSLISLTWPRSWLRNLTSTSKRWYSRHASHSNVSNSTAKNKQTVRGKTWTKTQRGQ